VCQKERRVPAWGTKEGEIRAFCATLFQPGENQEWADEWDCAVDHVQSVPGSKV
jgi:hypothetical protein